MIKIIIVKIKCCSSWIEYRFIEDIPLCYELKNIHYGSVKHNQSLFKYD
jgi:hypothetical protein